MSLSVDQLKRLEFVLSTDLGHHKNSGITPSWKLSKIADELQAIRELIAIKEAEPVAYIGNAYGDPVEFAEHELVVTGDIQKIPLFSHLIVRK